MMLKSLLSVATGKVPSQTPIWFMRQAGRYLPEYRKIRQHHNDFIQMILKSDVAAEITMQPLRRFDLNGAILFSDILLVPYAMGIDVKFIESKGPVITPVTELNTSVDRQIEVYTKINKTISIVAEEIRSSNRDITLIGFAGAPWTVMCYMVEGTLSKTFEKVRSFYLTQPEKCANMISQLVDSTILYLSGQIEAGAEVVKLFDSWAGAVPCGDFERLVIDPTKRITSALKRKYPQIPIIGFPRGAGLMYLDYAERSGVDVVAIDQNIPLNWARNNLQTNVALQGNMDNMVLAYADDQIENSVKKIMEDIGGSRLIFNLGHGVLPVTKVENIALTIDSVRKYERTNQ